MAKKNDRTNQKNYDKIRGINSTFKLKDMQPELTSNKILVKGFADFIRDHAVVSLAIGFVIATQVQALVKQLVDNFITPTFQFFFKNALVNDSLVFHFQSRKIVYNWGQFVNGLLDFIFVLGTIYVIVKLFKLERFNVSKKD